MLKYKPTTRGKLPQTHQNRGSAILRNNKKSAISQPRLFSTEVAGSKNFRYLPHTQAVRQEMLNVVGAQSVDELFEDIPEQHRVTDPSSLGLPKSKSEMEIHHELSKMSAKSMDASKYPFFVGGGLYNHFIPSVVDHVIQRSEFLTSYTPYQPEISQGTLQTMFEFQTQVAKISGVDVANSSMYDGANSCAEAVLMAQRLTRRGKVVLGSSLNPRYGEVVKTYAKHSGHTQVDQVEPEISEDFNRLINQIDNDTAAVVVQNPTVFGQVRDLNPLTLECHKRGVLVIAVFTEVLSLGALKPPGAMGADIVVGEGQSLGNTMGYGGPTVGLFGTQQRHMRQMPGRIVGQTIDSDGSRCYVLTLSTREQHIRREKATSNICTSAGLCALGFAVHLSLLGEKGFRDLASLNHTQAMKLYTAIQDRVPSVKIVNDTFFNEFTLELPQGTRADEVVERMAERKVLAGVPFTRISGKPDQHERLLITATTEECSDQDIENYVDSLKSVLGE
eukprot:gb/GECH01011403.1/.p1 GENE.gb/GECH01011403.1/~~gb/GECH01011403.1/.p1  ORF type:complete len:504 (+),score=130.66 gb/GECH01011403.1/:1-1512(+)